MNNYVARSFLALVACAGMVACAQERTIQIAEVPTAAIVAAEAAVEGLQIASAQVEAEGGRTVYELVGAAGGQAYEVEVTANGQVLEIETDD